MIFSNEIHYIVAQERSSFLVSQVLLQFQKIRDAIELHNTDRCSIGPPKGIGDLNLESLSPPKEKQAGSTAT